MKIHVEIRRKRVLRNRLVPYPILQQLAEDC